MKVRVKLFAVAKELAGSDELTIEVARRRDGRRRAAGALSPPFRHWRASCRTRCGPSDAEYAADDTPRDRTIRSRADPAGQRRLDRLRFSSRLRLRAINMIQLTDEPIDTAALVDRARHPEAGAVVLFLGTTRELTDGRQTVALDYEAYREMAEQKLAELEAEARRRWPVIECIIVHRLGRVPPAEASVAIVVSTPHRARRLRRRPVADRHAQSATCRSGNANTGPTARREWVHPGIDSRRLAATRSRAARQRTRSRTST